MINREKYPPLDLPPMDAKVRSASGMVQIFDRFRQKFIPLTPEEWVRQHYASNLVESFDVPQSRVLVESEIKYGGVKKRPDLAVVNRDGSIWLLAEFKAPEVDLSENVWQQAFSYAYVLNPKFVMISNGLKHIYGELRPDLKKFVLMDELPKYLVP